MLADPRVPAGTSPAGTDSSAPRSSDRRVVVIGLGNPVLGDDGVGWRVAAEVEARLAAERAADAGSIGSIEVERLGVGGLRLMEFLDGYDEAILVDAAEFPDRPIGEVRSCLLEELGGHGAGHLDSAHDASLMTALDLGARYGARLPSRISVVTIQARNTGEFSEALTPEVEAAVPAAVSTVLALLSDTGARR
jgi:hydrogenase maturation protease